MIIKALAPWFGAKRAMADVIVRQLGPHRAFWDVLCGSMAVLLAKSPVAAETVNDLNGDLVNLARVIVDERLGLLLYRKLRRTLCCKALLDDAAGRLHERGRNAAPDRPDWERAYDYFVTSWLGRNGMAGTESYNQGFCRRFTKTAAMRRYAGYMRWTRSRPGGGACVA